MREKLRTPEGKKFILAVIIVFLVAVTVIYSLVFTVIGSLPFAFWFLGPKDDRG